MEFLFAFFTAIVVGLAVLFIIRRADKPSTLVIAGLGICLWLWIGSALLPWAYAQPGLYARRVVAEADFIIDQADNLLKNTAFSNFIGVLRTLLNGIPFNIVITAGALFLFDSNALLALYLAVGLGIFTTLGGLLALYIAPRSTLIPIIGIGANSLSALLIVSQLPSIDALGTLHTAPVAFLVSLFGITYGFAPVAALIAAVMANVLFTFMLLQESRQDIPSARPAPKTPQPNRFAAGSGSRFSTSASASASPAKPKAATRPASALAIIAVPTAIGLLLGMFALPLVSYSPRACIANMLLVNQAREEAQKLSQQLPAEFIDQFPWLMAPQPVGAEDLFPTQPRKDLAREVCAQDAWTFSLWYLQRGGGNAWMLAMLSTLLLSGTLLFIGLRNSRSQAVPMILVGSALVSFLAVTQGLVMLETFGFHDDFSFRLISALAGVDVGAGYWVVTLIVVLVVPIITPILVARR